MRHLPGVLTVLAVLLVAGCGGGDAAGTTIETPTATIETPTAAATPTASGPPIGWVTRDSYEGEWPLTVDAGVVWCDGPAAVFVAPGAIAYALNGDAEELGYEEISPILRGSANADAPQVNLDTLIALGADC